MSFLGKAKKEDLCNLVLELGEEVPPNSKMIDLKGIIVGSRAYEEEFVRELLNSVIETRIAGEQAAKQKLEREHEIKMKELEIQSNVANGSESGLSEAFERTGGNFLGYLNVMKGVVMEPPEKAEEWPFFFHHAEMMFKLYEVPERFQGKIILHNLKGKVKNLSTMLGEGELDNYMKIKDMILKEFRITPLQHKHNFDKCFKRCEESYMQYASKVEAALDLYLHSREVTTFENLKELLVADKLKENLPQSVKSHIYLKEAEGWLSVSELAKEVDNYLVAMPKTQNSHLVTVPKFNSSLENRHYRLNEPKQISKNANFNSYSKERFTAKRAEQNFSDKRTVKCFNCQKEGHIKRFCPNLSVNQMTKTVKDNEKVEMDTKGLNKVCVTLNDPRFNFDDIPLGETESDLPRADFTIDKVEFKGVIDSGTGITVVRKAIVPEKYLESGGKVMIRPAIGSPVEARLISIPMSLKTEEGEVRPYIWVRVAAVDGLNEIALVTPKVYRLLKEQKEKYLGKDEVVVESEEICSRSLGKVVEGEEICCRSPGKVVVEGEEICRSPGKVVVEGEEICRSPGKVVVEDKEICYRSPGKAIVEGEEICGRSPEKVEVESEGICCRSLEKVEVEAGNPPLSQAQRFRNEQSRCESLQNAFVEAKQNKNSYWIESGILYHTGNLNGQKCSQLVVPQSRRMEILKLAHETLTGGHLASKKTGERIKISFWWEGLMKDVRKYCEACHECQLRRKTKIKDRAPIEAVGRPELPFQVVNADIFGPIEPRSARGHQYVLCVMDQHSRWPEAVPLTSLTAKATCEAFIQIFMRTGIPRIVAMDNGTNFAAKLTQEFLKQLGVTPKFSTPGYPQSNGLVERFIGTMKSMLHHAISTQGKAWDKQLPYLLWAYREVPNATTGVPPFLMVYGRLPVGPLAILKSSWEDDAVLPQGIGESVGEYLHELRDRLRDAEEFATIHATKQQEQYAHIHNLRSKEQYFDVGDEVVVLLPDSTNKVCAKWRGPGEIVEKISPHSYLVKLPDDRVSHLHQNKLRKYVQPMLTVGIIYETDEDFGEVQHAPVDVRIKVGEKLKEIDNSGEWNHLSELQRKQLNKIIEDYQVVFDGEIKCARVGSHVIRLKPEVERKQPHIYKIPEAVRPQVERQIAELLEKGLIEPSTAEIAYPIVCVAKKDGTVRLCCDYRGLNAESKIVPFPMQNSEELRFKAGAAFYLTTLDILKGYWEIPLEENCRELTSFVSPKGQYQWKVMPFGLSGSAATFQKVMNQALKPHSDYADSFIDDIIIYSVNWSDHVKHIKAVLETLKNLNFTANLEKCSFAKPEVKYLGHVVGSGRHGPDPEKIAVIRDLKFPKTKKTLRSILGLYNYYREYVPAYAKIAKPLTDLTRKSVPNDIHATEEAVNAFKTLKDALCKAVALCTPDTSKSFEIHSDASLTGIGACLVQRDDQGHARPISFISQKLTSAQTKWSTIEREALAVIWALGKFEMWTYGKPILLYTDHNPLKYLTESVPKNARLQRWALALQRYDVSVAHKPGNQNLDADALSRIEYER